MLKGNIGGIITGAIITAALVTFVAGIATIIFPALGGGLDNVFKVIGGAVLASIVGGMFSSMKGSVILSGAIFALSTWIVGIVAFGDVAAVDVMFVAGTTIVFVVTSYIVKLGRGQSAF